MSGILLVSALAICSYAGRVLIVDRIRCVYVMLVALSGD